jgi:chromosome segregation ATPase
MPRQDTATSFTIREAAVACGVSDDTIRRRLADDRFPHAEQHKGRTGLEWRIPASDLAQLAEAEGWDLDLAEAKDQQPDHLLDRYERLLVQHAEADAKRQLADGQVEQLTRERDQARSDLEHERAELRRLTSDLNEAERSTAIAEARTEELRAQLFVRSAELDEERQLRRADDKAFQERRELFNAELAAASAAHAASLAEMQQARDAMGWWSRRRYEKRRR